MSTANTHIIVSAFEPAMLPNDCTPPDLSAVGFSGDRAPNWWLDLLLIVHDGATPANSIIAALLFNALDVEPTGVAPGKRNDGAPE